VTAVVALPWIMATGAVTAASLLQRAELERSAGRGAQAVALYTRAAELAAAGGDLDVQVDAVLGLAGCQPFNETPGTLPVRLHEPYALTHDPRQRSRLASALARCWAYAGEPRRARPFADEALAIAESSGSAVLLADALDAALTAWWGPDELERRRGWAVRLGDAAAHLPDPDARLQAHLWALTLAWEVLDVSRILREIHALEVLADESPRARFFAASRRLALDLFHGRTHTLPALRAAAEDASRLTLIPDAFGVLHTMVGYSALVAGDAATCAAEAAIYEAYAVEQGVAVVRAEAAMMWLGAGRLDRIREMIGVFTPDALAALPRDSDWLLIHQCLLEGALAVEDADLAGDLAERLAPYPGRAVINAGAVMFHGTTDDTLGRAAALLGRRTQAERLTASALSTYDRVGAVWWRDRLRRARQSTSTRTRTSRAEGAGAIAVRLCQQAGGLWTVGRRDAVATLPDLRGLHHLRALVSAPDTEIPALALVGLSEGRPPLQESGLEILDEHARRAYRARLADIDRELDDATDRGDLGRLHRLQDERQALLEQLDRATGLGGRRRVTGSSEERARIAVRKAVVGALARIAEVDPWLGRHLRTQVQTGTLCSYRTDPDQPVRWLLHAASATQQQAP
jgi:tetratricopeptide (TPR) repeat protein